PFLSVQLLTEPLLQKKHSPQKVSTFTDTRSPSFTFFSTSRLDHLSYKLMAQDRSRNCFWNRPVFDMDITGTDRGQCYLQNDIPLIQDHWPWALLYPDFPISLIYNCFHLRPLLPALFF